MHVMATCRCRVMTTVVVIIALFCVSCGVAAAGARRRGGNGEATVDEDTYRPVIRCVACEAMVARYVGRMRVTPLGASVKAARLDQRGDAATQQRMHRATVAAWAEELLVGLCADAGDQYPRRYCDAELEACDERLVALATAHKLAGTCDAIDVNATAHAVCEKAGACELRAQMAKQVADMQASMRQRHLDEHSLFRLVLAELREHWALYLCGVLAVSLVTSACIVAFVLVRRRAALLKKRS